MNTCSAGFVLAVLCSVILIGNTLADLCDSNPCQNGGRCRKSSWSKKYYCYCERPHFGKNCEKVSPCASGNPCKNGGTCRAYTYSPGFYCRCPTTHVGKTCEKDNPCLKDQTLCQNGGSCYSASWSDKGYRCRCPRGYGGNNCELRSRCAENPCKNGGACRDNFWDKKRIYRCDCPEHYKGDNCQFEDPCKSTPCQNGGSCYSQLSYESTQKYDYHCYCSNMYYGENCQHESECLTKICHNGGTCYPYGNGEASCSCTDGFRGPTCLQKICPVKDTCRSRFWKSADFNNCTAGMRTKNAELATCASIRYEEIKHRKSCDCTGEDVVEAIRRIHMDLSNDEAMRCLQRRFQENWGSCSGEAMKCIEVFGQVLGGPTPACNETTKETISSCLDGYERGTLDLNTCPAAERILKMAHTYKPAITMVCAGCPHWFLGRNCSALKQGGSTVVYMCSFIEKNEEIIQCMIQEAQRWPHCSSLLNGLEDTLRSLVSNAGGLFREACTEYATYQKMWAEDWGCSEHIETNSKRSLEEQLVPWQML